MRLIASISHPTDRHSTVKSLLFGAKGSVLRIAQPRDVGGIRQQIAPCRHNPEDAESVCCVTAQFRLRVLELRTSYTISGVEKHQSE